MDLPFPPHSPPALQQPAPAQEHERLRRELGAELPRAPLATPETARRPVEPPFGGAVPTGSFHQGAARAMGGSRPVEPSHDAGKPFTFAF
ncbi:hypothetical protein [Sphingomonas quercus]|uniref:Uncharacterized protein n=1 Tax=Sphingomonas quercus TaxID=2842451 RepID=A0ABS6BLD8_9SPHN|nr:hypothetical protein [Sphingomonas quercus]MBU3078040.1 hypothetical protein [Sphingomonas quercus]